MHTIDESSPLYEVDFEKEHNILGFIVTLTGYDSTYAKTTYGRRSYNAADG